MSHVAYIVVTLAYTPNGVSWLLSFFLAGALLFCVGAYSLLPILFAALLRVGMEICRRP